MIHYQKKGQMLNIDIDVPDYIISSSLPKHWHQEISYDQIHTSSTRSSQISFPTVRGASIGMQFESSTCAIPPYQCDCLRIGVKYFRPLSYYIKEANRVDQSLSAGAFTHMSYLSPVKSLVVNQSQCTHDYPSTLLIKLILIRYNYPINILKNNSLMLLQHYNQPLTMESSEEEIEVEGSWWTVLYLPPHHDPIEDMNTEISINITCDAYKLLEVAVEYVKPGVEGEVYKALHPSRSYFRANILCNHCNIILRFQASGTRQECEKPHRLIDASFNSSDTYPQQTASPYHAKKIALKFIGER